jgi:hypothetical protein
MGKEYQFKLIEGQFSPLEAGKVLFALINSKVNFHNLEIFSEQIRFNEENSHSKSRVQSLLEAAEYLKGLIEQASLEDMDLNIESVIQITLSPKVKTASDV